MTVICWCSRLAILESRIGSENGFDKVHYKKVWRSKKYWNLLRYCVLWVPSSIESRRLVRNEQDSRKQWCYDYSKVGNLFRISNVHVSSRSHKNHSAHFTISRRYIPHRSTDSYKTAISPHLPTYTFTSKTRWWWWQVFSPILYVEDVWTAACWHVQILLISSVAGRRQHSLTYFPWKNGSFWLTSGT